ncbi:ERAD-associated E3 ubiquitin-protein ligase HRD1B-like [Prosopis cineraria]|uniref:ERAD-associated E3 ubiquitin-protein ligase HRD1B-like n=1 Tax=Prosopis cineraria TaxID=364024 RepID=UPI0024104D62|nr:ERAD-associated E3 ubiquitin-protein ligase HRD1B-like [Prosopis cineraria]
MVTRICNQNHLFGDVIEIARLFLERNRTISFDFIYREANICAHLLAQLSHYWISVDFCTYVHPPPLYQKLPVFTFYLELIRDLLHLSMYMCFFLVIFINYGVPLHLIWELYETFRNFKVHVADYIRYRKITSNMNDRFSDATPEELNASDATYIICREEMTTAKKLICGHLFHVHCLRSWLEGQHTCPTCRALVVPPENGATTAGGQHGSQSDRQGTRTGTSTGNSSQAEGGNGVATDNLSRHQVRLQTTAASMYEKSYVYPSPSATSLVWYISDLPSTFLYILKQTDPETMNLTEDTLCAWVVLVEK